MSLIALVRPPSRSIAEGERTYVDRLPIDLRLAREQHAAYLDALREAGCDILAVPAADHLPDAVFVEDTAFVVEGTAVIGRAGALSRRPEAATIVPVLQRYCRLVSLPPSATLDGGDVLVVGRTIYIGLSQRTNRAAIAYLTTIFPAPDYDVVGVPVQGCLHMKSAVSYLGDDTVLMNPKWVPRKNFAKHKQVAVDASEPMAANALLVGKRLLMSQSYPETLNRVRDHGFRPHALDVGEFHKAEGALTCLSILFMSAGEA